MNMFGGLLAFLGIYAGSAAKAVKDNYDMKKISLGMIKALTGYAIVLIGVGNLGI